MALILNGANGALFERLGRIGALVEIGYTFQGSLLTQFTELMQQYDSSVANPLALPMNGVPAIRDSAISAVMATYMNSLKAAAKSTVIEMVKADKPTAAGSIGDALAEVAKQLVDQAKTIPGAVVAATAAAYGTNQGDGIISPTTARGDGYTNQLIYPELAYIRCVADAQTGGATVGQEQFRYTGEVKSPSIWDKDYPIGSGQTAGFTAIDATVDGDASTNFGNLLVSGDFENFTANLPDNWTAPTGTAGVDFQKSTATKYSGLASLQIIGGATLTCLDQKLFASTGSAAEMQPATTYAFCLRAKVDVVPAAGVLRVELVDSTGTLIVDATGVSGSNRTSTTLSTLTTSFTTIKGFFRLPRSIPSEVHVRLKISTALSGGSNLFIDHFAIGRVTEAYVGGPGLAAFSGATPFVVNDLFTLTTTNDYDTATGTGGSPAQSFNWFLDRMFDTRNLRLLFPVSGAPTISNALMTP